MGKWVIGLCAAGALVAAAAASSQVILAPTVFHSATLRSDSITTFTVTCPPGHVAVSAGVSSAAKGVTTLSIRPSGARAYVFRFGNPSTNPDQTVTVAVACRKIKATGKAPFLKLVRLKTGPIPVPAGGQKQIVIPCPNGTVPAGGGIDLAPPKGKALASFSGTPLELRRQNASLNRFTFTVRNGGPKARPAVLYGSCATIVRPQGSAPGRLHVKVLTQTTPVQAGTQTIKRSCPSGWVAFATGYTLAPNLTLGGSAATDGGGKWTITNAARSQVLADLQLTCARVG